VSYSYAEAVADRICRPVCFVAYDGTLSWRSGEDVIESSFETVLSTREASRRYRTAISTELPDGLPRILREADAKLREIRAGGHREINAWCNRKLGIASVEQATLSELERSVQLLVGKLSGRR
jgi:hypothetical protein